MLLRHLTNFETCATLNDMKTKAKQLDDMLHKGIVTYGDMLEALKLCSPEQLRSNITIELEEADEFYPAEFRICGDNHQVLDDGHPVIFTKFA